MSIKKILLVNDDGIFHDTFKKTVSEYIRLGYDVTVCAPLNPQSAKSHAIEIRNEIAFKKVDIFGNIDAYAIDSTPADCVRFAKYYLNWEGDLVVSGINNGLNLGDDILYSGTVAASAEAGIRGYKTIALSSEHNEPENGLVYIKKVMDFIEENDLFSKWNAWSFNIPKNPKGFKLAHQGNVNFSTYFEETRPGYFLQLGRPHHELDLDQESDVYLYEHGYVTYSAISQDRTCNEKIKK